MKKPAISTAAGLLIGIVCIAYSIKMSGDLSMFLNWPSVFITIGGTLGVIVVSFPPHRLKTLGKVMRRAFKKDNYDLAGDIQTIIKLSEIARKKGTLALEDTASAYADDPFMQKGILMIADGVDEETLQASLMSEIYFMQKRHQKGYAMLDMIASTTTSLGLLGTYIGLIPMLTHLEDPTKLGPLMAIELVTSFYGAFLAYVIFGPISKKLKTMSSEEATRMELLIEGFTSIQKGLLPMVIEERMVACLSKKEAQRFLKVNPGKSKEKMKGVA